MASSWTCGHGANFAQGLGQVLGAAGVSTVEVLRFVRPHAFLGREVSEQARMLARAAREEHRNRGYGFWEALLSSSVSAERSTRRGILSQALTQREPLTVRQRLPVGEFLNRLENGAYADLPERGVAALCSRISLNGEARDMHLPMIDFAIMASPHNDEVMVDLGDSLGLHGSIFDSGKSYHFYGARPLSADELPRFLARAQLLAPLVDHRWVCHQILDGECSLRISTDRERHKVQHRAVASSL